MSSSFILSCESTVDLPYAYVSGRDIPVLFYSYMIDGTTYEDDMFRTPGALNRFYEQIDAGALPTTAQLNAFQYEQFFEPLLEKGDLLHICFGTGMTASYQNAVIAADALREKYPDRKIEVIDSLCSSTGYGFLVDYAADLRDDGKPLEDTAAFVLANRRRVHHQFYSTQLDMYRRSGRMSGAAATVATILNICPIMRLDDGGHIIAYSKVRGKKAAIAYTVDYMEAHAEGGRSYDQKCFICHSHCPEDAKNTLAAVEERFPQLKGKVRIYEIGTIIASHCGPGTVAVFYLGDERKPEV